MDAQVLAFLPIFFLDPRMHTAPQAFHQQGLDNLQVAMQRTRKLCASVMDTLGPEIVVLNRCGGRR